MKAPDPNANVTMVKTKMRGFMATSLAARTYRPPDICEHGSPDRPNPRQAALATGARRLRFWVFGPAQKVQTASEPSSARVRPETLITSR